MKTVLRNANIYTMNEAMPLAQAVVIGGDRILYVGPDDEASWSAVAGREAMVCDMKGKYIYPGMIDSHTHPGMVAQSSWHVRLPWTDDLDVILEFIRDYAENIRRDSFFILNIILQIFSASVIHKNIRRSM